MELKSVRMCSLPREARLVFTLYGRGTFPAGDKNAKLVKRELGWASLQLFNFERY